MILFFFFLFTLVCTLNETTIFDPHAGHNHSLWIPPTETSTSNEVATQTTSATTAIIGNTTNKNGTLQQATTRVEVTQTSWVNCGGVSTTNNFLGILTVLFLLK